VRKLTAVVLMAVLTLVAGTAFGATLDGSRNVANLSTSDTIPAYMAVISDTAFIGVTANTGIGVDVDTTVAVADSLHGHGLPVRAKRISYRLRIRFVAGDAADTVRKVRIYGNDGTGIPIDPYYEIKFSTLATAAKDTYTTKYLTRVTAVTATGSHAADSVQVFAEMPMPIRRMSDSNAITSPFVGITQGIILPRELGAVKFPGESSYVYCQNAVRAGYCLYAGDDSVPGMLLGARALPDSGTILHVGTAIRGTTARGAVWTHLFGDYLFKSP